MAASQWLDTPRVEYLLTTAVATGIAGVLAVVRRPLPTRWGLAAALAMLPAIAAAGLEQRELYHVERDWPAHERDLVAEGGALLAQRMETVLASLRETAHRALEASSRPGSAFTRLDALARAPEERGIVVYRGGRPAVWGGRVRVLPDEGGVIEGAGIATSSFYLAVYAAASRGDTTALAMALVHASAPADRFARTIAGEVAADADLRGFAFAPARDDGESDSATVVIGPPDAPLFAATPVPPNQGAALQREIERARLRVGAALVLALAMFVLAAWRAGATITWRAGALAVALGCAAVVPLNQLSNLSRLFDSTVYFTGLGGPLTANAGALLLTSALVLLGLLAVVRRHRGRLRRPAAVTAVVLVAGLGPFLLRDLARGIRIPPGGVDTGLWLIWEIPLFLAAVSVLLAGATAGGLALGAARGLPPFAGPLLAGLAALLGPAVWQAPAGWPWWYTLLWVAAIAALALARPSRYGVLAASLVAALGATSLVWANTARGRVALAERDLAGLTTPDTEAEALLRRLARDVAGDPPPPTREGLLQAFVATDLAAAEYPTAFAAWDSATVDTVATLRTGAFEVPREALRALVERARAAGEVVLQPIAGWPGVQVAAAIPAGDLVYTAAVAPRTSLIVPEPFARMIGVEREVGAELPYSIRLIASPFGAAPDAAWRREGSTLRGIVPVRSAAGAMRALVDVELRPLGALVQRGTLLVLLDLALVALLWALTVVADGRLGRWLRARRHRWRRSFRARLSLTLFLFFVIPAAIFAVWSYQQLIEDGRRTRVLLVRETLRAATEPEPGEGWLARESARLQTPLVLFSDGILREASEDLYEALAPTGLLLRPDVRLALARGDEIAVSRADAGAGSLLFGYRAMEDAPGALVLAAPARGGDVELDRRREDLGILVLFATAVGALAALALSGIAARQLATPVGSLRGAALAIARGEREPALEAEPPVEFRPVFTAFRRMASDLSASRSALEAAQQRTAAVLRNVASGVIALDASGRVTLANPRAEALLGAELPPGTPLRGADSLGIADRAESFLRSGRDEDGFDLDGGSTQLRGRLTRLGAEGVVVTIDDVTALARAQRVLAWGEMARQVAHEIKNPLTPIRLGVQHLRRARHNPRVDFDTVLDQNVTRILEEIDRLDEIARAFSRYGSAPAERAPAEPVDVARVVRDLAALETMGEGHVRFVAEGADDEVCAFAQAGELREVLLNLVENARLAEAREVRVTVARAGGQVTIAVRDDGHGIPPDVLPRIFEPHFSTRTSGSGLGLAISRRMVEGWGGGLAVQTEVGRGTEVTVTLRAA